MGIETGPKFPDQGYDEPSFKGFNGACKYILTHPICSES